jgi:hypothetical protein
MRKALCQDGSYVNSDVRSIAGAYGTRTVWQKEMMEVHPNCGEKIKEALAQAVTTCNDLLL